ncbi:MAG: calcium/sodium antiporter [Pseudomonadota bacterium]
MIALFFVVRSAAVFIDGAADTAQALGVSPLIIGVTIVGFGTSAPEILISIFAALQGNPGLAVGNAIGSNIANIALILGATACLYTLFLSQHIVRRELPLLVLVQLLLIGLVYDADLSRVDGIILLLGLVAVMGRTVLQGIKASSSDEAIQTQGSTVDTRRALIKLLLGLGVLLASSRALVWGAVDIASALGVSDLVIGLTVVAIGTSLPELAACIASARIRAFEIAIGNIIGSNVFNSLAVVGISGVIHPAALPPDVWARDLPIALGLAVLLLVLSVRRAGKAAQLGRI